MNENDKQVSGVEATANPAPSQGRRRLMKGAMLATPAVMTLMSGRLAAAASSVMCTPPKLTETEISQATVGALTNYVDDQGHALLWGRDSTSGSLTLGYMDGDVFTQATPSATSSCWASLPY